MIQIPQQLSLTKPVQGDNKAVTPLPGASVSQAAGPIAAPGNDAEFAAHRS
jgi:hypothetical protein